MGGSNSVTILGQPGIQGGQQCLAYKQYNIIVVPIAGENVTHVSSDIKVQRKSLVVLAKLDSWVVSLCSHSFLLPEILLKKKKATWAAGRRKGFSHLLWANQRDSQ